MPCLRYCVFCVLWLPSAALLDALTFFHAHGRRQFSEREASGEGEFLDRAEAQDSRLASQSFRDYQQNLRSHRLDRRQGLAKKQVPLARRPPASNFCPRYPGGGWHAGSKEAELKPSDAPNGATWTWEDCARECALRDSCQYWTLQLSSSSCTIMSKRGRYHNSDNHVEGPRDPECLRAQPTGPIAGTYEVRYKNQQRDWNMVVHCNSSVSHPGILTDKTEPRRSDFHVSASPSSQCIRRWPQSTVLIFNTRDSSKFECLQQDSMTKLRGSRFYASGQLFGDVEYRLAKTFTCGFEQANGSNESVLVESIDDQGPDLEESSDDAEDSQDAQSELITDVADVDVAAERAEQPAAGADVDAEASPAEVWSKEDEATDAPEMAPALAPFAPHAPAAAPTTLAPLTPTLAEAARAPLSPLAAVSDDQLKEQPAAADNVTTSAANATAPGNETAPEAAAGGDKRADANASNASNASDASDASTAPPAAAATEKKEAMQCASWCEGHKDEWDMKCTFKGCGACGACAAKGAPTAAAAAANETATAAHKDDASKKDAAKEEEEGQQKEELAEEPQEDNASKKDVAKEEEEEDNQEDEGKQLAEEQKEDEDKEAQDEDEEGRGRNRRRTRLRRRRSQQREEGEEAEDATEVRLLPGPGRGTVAMALGRAIAIASGSSPHLRDKTSAKLGGLKGVSFIEHLDKMLVSGLARISNTLDGHKQRINVLSGELDFSAMMHVSALRSEEPLSVFLQEGLPEIERRRLDLEAVIDDTLEKVKRALANAGHAEVAPELDECLEANRQAGTLTSWFFGLGGSDMPASGGEEPPAPQDQILAMDAACAQLKPAEDALASQFRTTFRTLTRNIALSKAVADEPEFQQKLEEFQQRVLQKATTIAWSLHSCSMELTKLVKGWSAHAAATSDAETSDAETSETFELSDSSDSSDSSM